MQGTGYSLANPCGSWPSMFVKCKPLAVSSNGSSRARKAGDGANMRLSASTAAALRKTCDPCWVRLVGHHDIDPSPCQKPRCSSNDLASIVRISQAVHDGPQAGRETVRLPAFEWLPRGQANETGPTLHPYTCPRLTITRSVSTPRPALDRQGGGADEFLDYLRGSSCIHTRIGFEPCGSTSSWASALVDHSPGVTCPLPAMPP